MAKLRLARSGRGAAPDRDKSRPSGDADVLAWCRDVVAKVNAHEAAAWAYSDDDLRGQTMEFRRRLADGEPEAALLPEAFATVREAARRSLGLRHHDVQIMGGAVLRLGMIAEMRTGEGKTLTATLPAFLSALTGGAVHVMTANDYLAARDWDWMRPVYEFLGLTVGLLRPAGNPEIAERRTAYAADVTYGAWDQFCYDFLRDNLAWRLEDCTQRGLAVAIVDEADLVLIDEMRVTPQISRPAEQPVRLIEEVAKLVAALLVGTDYVADSDSMTASLTDAGARRVEGWSGVANLYDEQNLGFAHLVDNALKAKELYARDRDYAVLGDEAVILDNRSGRPIPGRRYGDGVHQAIEAREGLPVRPATEVLAAVAVRDYLRQYERLAGMTGTAVSDAPVYRDLYQLDVVAIPTNRPTLRVDHPDLLYKTRTGKLAAIASEACRRQASGQPVLIGASSAQDAQAVGDLLAASGVRHDLLAARNYERESEIIADAGRAGAVTIVVKMAGRGVDIVLGGATGADYDAVAGAGGLCVLGAARSLDRRAELHVRGRAGRQGDPGESRFFVSADDDVVKQVGKWAPVSMLADGTAFPRLSAAIDHAQAKMSTWQATSLGATVAYDEVQAEQQRLIYAERRTVLAGQDLPTRVLRMLDDAVHAAVIHAIEQGSSTQDLVAALKVLYPACVQPGDLVSIYRSNAAKDRHLPALSLVTDDARQAYARREAELGSAVMRELERRALLSVTDRAWRAHLAAIADLLSGLTIRAAGGTVQLPEFRREAARLLQAMTDRRRREAIILVFSTRIKAE